MSTWFSRSTINARMVALALLSAALTLAVGLFGMLQTSKVTSMLNTMYDTNLVPIADVANANMQAIYHNRAMFTFAAEDDAGLRAKQLEGAQKNVQRMNELLDKYRKTYLTPKEIDLLRQFDAAWPPYMAASAKVIKTVSEGKVEDALAQLTDEVAPVFQKADDILSELVDFNVALGKTAYDESNVVAADARMYTLAVIVFAVLFSVAGALFISRSITRPLGGEPVGVVAAVDAVAQGDLRYPIRVLPGDTASVVARMAAMQASLVQVVSGVRQNAEGVASASAQIADGNQDLSGRTEEQASALEQTAASMEELGATVQHNVDNVRQANQLTQTASEVARQCGDVVGQVVGTMKDINDSSSRIAEIITVIDGIAFQTNILALNAAVEAARAGEQGRGFAVVAGEVRSLAQRSAEAAKEIKALITASVDRVATGSQLVDKAGTTMQEVVASILRVNEIMGDIRRASEEQSSSVAQIGQAVTQMDQATQQNAALVEESAAAAESLRHQAGSLLEQVAVFKLDSGDGKPAMAVRAAPTAPKRAAPALRRPPVRAKPLAVARSADRAHA